VWCVALWAARLGTGAVACWLWPSGLGVVTAALLPGISPYFVFPSLVAAAVLPFAVSRRALLLLPALASLIVWLGLLVQSEELLGLQAHPLFTVPAAFALMALAPLLGHMPRRRWIAWVCATGVLALVFAVVAGLLAPYSPRAPQRLNLHYVESNGRAFWAFDPVRPVPAALKAAAAFAAQPRSFAGAGRFYAAPAGRARFPAPSATVRRQGGEVRLLLHASPAADIVSLTIPRRAGLVSATVAGQTFALKAGPLRISCATAPCRQAQIVLGVESSAPFSLLLTEERFGLPPGGAKLAAARGPAAVPSQFGDTTLLVTRLDIPGR
jgi:hypothetical protein